MAPDRYPKDTSEEEADLGFQVLQMEGLGALRQAEIAVIRMLSSSDILIKDRDLEGAIIYRLQRWGYSATVGKPNAPYWHPLFTIESVDLPRFIQEFAFTALREPFPNDIVPCSFPPPAEIEG